MTDAFKIWEAFEKKGFLAKMREKLRQREYKNMEWKEPDDIPLKLLFEHLYSEIEELKQADYSDNVQEEVCDIANLCGFIFISKHQWKISDLKPLFKEN